MEKPSRLFRTTPCIHEHGVQCCWPPSPLSFSHCEKKEFRELECKCFLVFTIQCVPPCYDRLHMFCSTECHLLGYMAIAKAVDTDQPHSEHKLYPACFSAVIIAELCSVNPFTQTQISKPLKNITPKYLRKINNIWLLSPK